MDETQGGSTTNRRNPRRKPTVATTRVEVELEDEDEDEEGNLAAPEIDAQPFGPTADSVARLSEVLLAHPILVQQLGGVEHRLLSMQFVDSPAKSSAPCPADRFVAQVADYTNGRILRVAGELSSLDAAVPGEIEVAEFADDPLPSREEFDQAVEILRHDRELRAQIDSGELEPYQPMPPLLSVELPDGRIDRSVAVGLANRNEDGSSHRIVGVNLFSHRIDVRNGYEFPRNAPCEPPPSAEGCASTGTTGQVTVTVTQGGQVVWRFVVVRPAASSGTNGSGIELRYVDYRGKRVLYRAHVPILNIEYLPGAPANCGPTYRDWQNSEACFQANGVDVSPGFRLCASPATTILDSGSDAGNFRGVAIYVQGQEVVLVSEMTAGWYRYISEWRFHTNGTIRPRWGFAAVDNPCTCSTHIHHVYWRFDFDIRTSWNNIVEEFNDPPIFPNANWHTKTFEIRRPRDASRHRRWKVSNAATREGYEIVPGPDDGNQDSYGVGDLWVLRYHGNELDDGQGFTTNPALSQAHLDQFKSPAEPVANTDVVLWYAGHFRHDQAHAGGERLGPELRPVNW